MVNEELQALLDSYDDTMYPSSFLSEYTLMECLSDRNGIQTFLVQNSGGEKMIAKCCDKSSWSIRERGNFLSALEHEGLPRLIDTFENDMTTVTVREYIEGVSLDQYAADHSLFQHHAVLRRLVPGMQQSGF